MKDASRRLLQKLANGRPKPTKQTLRQLFLDIQGANIDELVSEITETSGRKTSKPKASALETHTKARLRKIGGKAKEFQPYLIDATTLRIPGSVKQFEAAKSLSAKLTTLESLLGKDATLVVNDALEKFISENDVSYRLART